MTSRWHVCVCVRMCVRVVKLDLHPGLDGDIQPLLTAFGKMCAGFTFNFLETVAI